MIDPTPFVLGGIALVVLVSAAAMFNGLVQARQRVRESWSDVDTELKRRHDLIPNLVETVKGYMTHEREVLERIISLREQAERLRPGDATEEQERIEGELEALLRGLSIRMEAYPDLKASPHFLALQGELANTEDRIAAALRYYNGNVRDLNVRCESFPSLFIARLFRFRQAKYFELEDAVARAAPQVGI